MQPLPPPGPPERGGHDGGATKQPTATTVASSSISSPTRSAAVADTFGRSSLAAAATRVAAVGWPPRLGISRVLSPSVVIAAVPISPAGGGGLLLYHDPDLKHGGNNLLCGAVSPIGASSSPGHGALRPPLNRRTTNCCRGCLLARPRGQRMMYGQYSPDADVLEDESDLFLWCWRFPIWL